MRRRVDDNDDVAMTQCDEVRLRGCRKAVDSSWDPAWEQSSTSWNSAWRRLQLLDHLLRDHDEDRAVQLRQHHTERYVYSKTVSAGWTNVTPSSATRSWWGL